MDKATRRKVWPRAHLNEENLKLPISPHLKKNRGEVVATEVVETVKLGFPIPEIKVYEELTDTLTEHAGYKRGDIDDPPPDGDHDTFYLFSYDWRCDNVESAYYCGDCASGFGDGQNTKIFTILRGRDKF